MDYRNRSPVQKTQGLEPLIWRRLQIQLNRQRVGSENARAISEIDAVFLDVGTAFGLVPGVSHNLCNYICSVSGHRE